MLNLLTCINSQTHFIALMLYFYNLITFMTSFPTTVPSVFSVPATLGSLVGVFTNWGDPHLRAFALAVTLP